MIAPINYATNFRGVYTKKGSSYSGSQLRTIENIKTNLGDKKDTMDFFVGPGLVPNSVCLSRVLGLKKLGGVGVESDEVTWKDSYIVGTYDEGHPFKKEDLKLAEKNFNTNQRFLYLIMGIAVVGLMIVAFCKGRNPREITNPEVKTELVNKFDTLSNNLIKNVK